MLLWRSKGRPVMAGRVQRSLTSVVVLIVAQRTLCETVEQSCGRSQDATFARAEREALCFDEEAATPIGWRQA